MVDAAVPSQEAVELVLPLGRLPVVEVGVEAEAAGALEDAADEGLLPRPGAVGVDGQLVPLVLVKGRHLVADVDVDVGPQAGQDVEALLVEGEAGQGLLLRGGRGDEVRGGVGETDGLELGVAAELVDEGGEGLGGAGGVGGAGDATPAVTSDEEQPDGQVEVPAEEGGHLVAHVDARGRGAEDAHDVGGGRGAVEGGRGERDGDGRWW